MNRRGFLKLLAVAPLALPAALKAIPPAARSLQQAMNELWVKLRARERDDLVLATDQLHADIIAATIESRSRAISDNISKDNALLRHLQLSGLPPEERATLKARWKLEREQDFVRELTSWAPRERYSRGQMVRVDSRCPSGYAGWLEENAC